MLGNYVYSTALFHHHFIKVRQAAYKNPRQYWTMKLASFWWIFWKIIVFLSKMQYKASFGRINKLHFIPSQCTTMMIMVNLNVTVIVLQTAVRCFISLVIPTICLRNPRTNKIKFFSNLWLIWCIYHEHDFNLKAEHYFFATSHGKNPCGVIAGTIKREATNASLRAAVTDQILIPEQLFLWAKENINGATMYCYWRRHN